MAVRTTAGQEPGRGLENAMFKMLFRHRGKAATVDQKLAMQREMERRRKAQLCNDTTLRANIANKLKNYRADEDATISNFTLAEDVVDRNLLGNSSASRGGDVWGQADPRETGRWKKENRGRPPKYR